MGSDGLVISRGKLQKGELNGKVALITGAGGGIGYEAARSLIWLGAKVIIAEINKAMGRKAEKDLNSEFGDGSALFIHTDVGNKRSVGSLKKKVFNAFGRLDIIINNATIATMGAVHNVPIEKWDLGYDVNVRGPVLLISSFLPYMLKNNSGIIVMVPSSGAAPYMGAYEVFKTAQVELANTLSAELEETGVITFSIGPGIVKTATAHRAIEEIAPLYGKNVDEFYQMSENLLLSVEEAGAGFAASVALSSQYRGLEIGSIQALKDAGIEIKEKMVAVNIEFSEEERADMMSRYKEIRDTFIEQIEAWRDRPVFERQWLIRDFKKTMGAAPEFILEDVRAFEKVVSGSSFSKSSFEKLPLKKISSYYKHQLELLQGYEKNPDKLMENTKIIIGWIDKIEALITFIDDLIAKKAV